MGSRDELDVVEGIFKSETMWERSTDEGEE